MKKMGKNNLETVKINSGVSQQKTRPLSMFLSQEKLVHSFCAYKYTLLIAITWNILIVNQYLGSALDHTTSAALLHTSCQVYTNYQTMKYLSSSNRQCVVHSHTDCYNMPYLHDEQKKGTYKTNTSFLHVAAIILSSRQQQ